ncbi:hypothetical protein [Rhodospirillum centenum]|uniref:hypothetical protein n=1 Tax=Rhodospirillum centenum TaxID=34018 RepID=UPI0003015A41|nr:hypothetical protein [Rhodospirillum centenum]
MLGSAVILLLGLAIGDARAAEFRSGDTARATGRIESDLFIAGRTVGIDASIDGALFAAGLNVAQVGTVSDDAMIAGFDVSLDGPVAGDLLAIGANVKLTSTVAGDAVLVAAELHLTPGSTVAGDLNASGGEVDLAGTVAGDARVAGGRVAISGAIMGDLDVAAGELLLLPGARIMGTLRHAGPDRPDIPAGVTVEGGIEQQDETVEETEFGPTLAGTLGGALALFLLGAAVYLAFPGFVGAAAAEVGGNPGRTLLLGVVALLATPLLVGLLMLTVIGIPVGLLLLLLYGIAIVLGLAIAGFGVAELMTRNRPAAGMTGGTRLKRFAFFALLLTLAGLVPLVGAWIWFAAVAMGVGAVLARTLASRRPPAYA